MLSHSYTTIIEFFNSRGVFRGLINFVGGWMSDDCPDPGSINTVTFARGAPFANETLWLYGRNDPFYSVDCTPGGKRLAGHTNGSGRIGGGDGGDV